MKKLIVLCSFLLLMGTSLFISKEVAAEPNDWYEIKYYMEFTSSGTYLVTECTEIPGNACNSPGSIHRTDISIIWGLIN
ncbi:MAG: hypothetical protein U5Q03_05730 [Bacteroidota bacterium]|nr:hypothetical protein [Bacteroidota bacterium]